MKRKFIFNLFKPIDLFHIDVAYFPKETKAILSLEFIKDRQMLPLGIRKKPNLFRRTRVLNIGCLDSKSCKAQIEAINSQLDQSELGRTVEGIQFYQLEAAGYAAALVDVYDVETRQLSPELKMAYEIHSEKVDESADIDNPPDTSLK